MSKIIEGQFWALWTHTHTHTPEGLSQRPPVYGQKLSGLVAGDSAICGRLAALILRLRPAGLRLEEFRSLVKKGRVGLAILKSQRVEAGCDLNLLP